MFTLGLGLKLYTPGEVVVSVMVSSIIILALGLTLTSVFLIWRTAKTVAGWARVPSRNPALLTCLTAGLARPRVTE